MTVFLIQEACLHTFSWLRLPGCPSRHYLGRRGPRARGTDNAPARRAQTGDETGPELWAVAAGTALRTSAGKCLMSVRVSNDDVKSSISKDNGKS